MSVFTKGNRVGEADVKGSPVDKLYKNGKIIYSKTVPEYVTNNMIVWIEAKNNGIQDLTSSTTSMRDKSGHGRHVTLYNAKWSDASVTFTGADSCYGVFSNLAMNTRSSFTICATYKILDYRTGNPGVVCTTSTGYDRFFFGYNASGGYVQNVTSPADIWWAAGNGKIGEIAYICMTFAHSKDSGSSFRIYKNGEQVGYNANMGLPTQAWANVVELCRSWGGSNKSAHPNANIQLYDLVMYDGCLSADDIRNNYRCAREKFGISMQGATVRISFDITPSDATVVVKDLAGTTIQPVGDKIYDLTSGQTYTYTVTARGYRSYSGSVDVIKSDIIGLSLSKDFSTITFAEATDDELRDMLQAHRDGTINLANIWHVGDTRKIRLNAIQDPDPTRSSTTWAAQDIIIVIVEFNRYNINGTSRKAPVVVQTRECLNNLTSGSNEIGTVSPTLNASWNNNDNWNSVAMRSWLNNQFFTNAIPTALKDLIPSVSRTVITSSSTTSTTTVSDKIFLPAHSEIWGSRSSSVYYPSGTQEGTVYSYYNTSSNRLKYGNNNGASNGKVVHWYTGSPSKAYNSTWRYAWCCTDNSGGDNAYFADSRNGIAPAFCLGL